MCVCVCVCVCVCMCLCEGEREREREREHACVFVYVVLLSTLKTINKTNKKNNIKLFIIYNYRPDCLKLKTQKSVKIPAYIIL